MNASRWAPKDLEPSNRPANAPTAPAETVERAPSAPEAFAANPLSQEPEVISSYEPPSFDHTVDEFAQTVAPDDLFDDDITPITEPVKSPFSPQPMAAAPSTPQVPTTPNASTPQSRGRGGRGRGRGRGGAGGHATPKSPAAANGEASAPQKSAPEGEKPTVSKDAAVRGDRSGTGGVKRDKLTETELAERLERISAKNASLTAAHARAEADLASFEAREAAAAQQAAERRRVNAVRQRQERVNRTAMMGERELNRQRKLNAMGGREWDEGKGESFVGLEKERRGNRRGAFGGVVGGAGRGEASPQPASTSAEDTKSSPAPESAERGRSREGARGGRDRGGRGRGGRSGPTQPQQTDAPAQSAPTAVDFPDLPAAAQKAADAAPEAPPQPLKFPMKPPKPKIQPAAGQAKADEGKAGEGSAKATAAVVDPLATPTTPGGSKEKRSWADQVEAA